MYTEEYLAEILRLTREMHDAVCTDSKAMSLDEIAKHYGVSKQSLHKGKKYLLPNFGRKKDGAKRNTYTWGEVLEWERKGIENLKREYMTLKGESDWKEE